MTTLYLSMSANEKDLEIEDDLAKGNCITWIAPKKILIASQSPKDPARPQVQNIITIEEKFRLGEGCQVPRLPNSAIDPKSDGFRRGA